jgi:alpha-glucan,water dikinase
MFMREDIMPSLSTVRVLREEVKGKNILLENEYRLDEGGQLAVTVSKDDKYYEVTLIANIPGPLILHWGVAMHSRYEWTLPPASLWPAGTILFEKSAAQTPFVLDMGLNRLRLEIKEECAPLGIPFVLKQPDAGRWLKNRGQNFYIPVSSLLQRAMPLGPGLSYLAEDIIQAEMGRHSWTLMHRFNLCHDLLDRVRNDVEGLALLFVWLRFSAIRQVDWQRNYNTKPRELSHAQDRLTLKLADVCINEPVSRELIRLMMTTLGRGGEGQRIRDEILNIMHRHHIKEVSNNFMEQWHQKLHNNTTPDDIAICGAYLEFLKSDGDLNTFYRTLEAGGVTRKRLESFERPILIPPDFVPHLKEGLIYDFENYLKLLKSVHSGTDLESAINAARYILDARMSDLLAFIWQYRDDSRMVVDLIGRLTEARCLINSLLNKERDGRRARDILCLDLALEEFLRTVVERNIHLRLSREQLVELIGMVLENLRISHDEYELSECSRNWKRLKGLPRFSQDWSLHAKSVLDRLGRDISAIGDRYYQLFQSKAEFLGRAFHANSWTVNLFTEEVVRGRPAFVLSMLMHHLEPILRQMARLGDWQVISPGKAKGIVEVTDTLRSVQWKIFDRPMVIIADKVRGDEEPPEGLTAVITKDAVDLVSHVAVRARNAGILFATCYDRDCFDRLKSLKGHLLDLTVNVSGDVLFEEVTDEAVTAPSQVKLRYSEISRPSFTTYAISSKDFKEGLVGSKSNNLRCLEGRLPDWIHLPASVALPFGVFENVLALSSNREIAERCWELLSRIEENPREVLAETRRTLLELQPPDGLASSLRRVMEDAGLGWPEDWDNAWMCIKRVWASKWNERAYLSRKARGIPHEDLFMAVLIQQVVEAEYAFVIHTVNPFTGNRDELYAEVVLGLGETLVGNYPGKALGFTSGKEAPEPQLLSYPSKSIGLFDGGLIFRSDSNGEDLTEYAGAGLYDSVMLEPPREVPLNYTEEPLIWDEDFRRNLLSGIANIGITIENAFGSPQDIEGAYARGRYYVVQTRPQV